MKHKRHLIRISIISICCIFAVHFGCKESSKNSNKHEKQNISKKLNAGNLLTAWSSGGSYDDVFYLWNDQWYDAFTGITTDKGRAVGDVSGTLNDLTISGDPMSQSSGIFSIDPLNQSQINAKFGSTNTLVSTGGTGYNAFSKAFYVPLKLQISYQNVNNFEISKTLGFTVVWNVDNSNPNDVLLYVEDINNPSNNFYTFVSDPLGQYTFNSSDLSSFSVGSRISVSVLRGIEESVNGNGRIMAIRAGSIINSPSMKVL